MKLLSRWMAAGRQLLLCLMIIVIGITVEQFITWQEYQTLPILQQRTIPLDAESRQLARQAWRYFEVNRLPSGLVSSVTKFPATTMWDVASQLAGMTAAHELGLIQKPEFDRWLHQALVSLATLPLYRGELPNKSYNANTLQPVSYGKLYRRQEIGFSALDLGRLALWLDIIAHRYPEHASASRAVTDRWQIDRLERDGYLMGTDTRSGRERWLQEGRLGYEQYAAYGLAKIGVKAPRALNPQLHRHIVTVLGVPIATDNRTTYPNYVTSEPYVLDGIETGFRSLPMENAQRILQAQQRRFRSTGKWTAWSEENLDRAPWFVYNCVVTGGLPWQTMVPARQNNPAYVGNGKKKLRYHDPSAQVSSTKTAVSWYVLFPNRYTEHNYVALKRLADPQQGVFGGVYEQTQEVNRSLSLNTNGQILEALFYRTIGSSMEAWAYQGASRA